MKITDRPEDLPPKATPEIFISYAWGDDSSESASKHGEVVEQFCETLRNEGWYMAQGEEGAPHVRMPLSHDTLVSLFEFPASAVCGRCVSRRLNE